jgi:hypothetical protein
VVQCHAVKVKKRRFGNGYSRITGFPDSLRKLVLGHAAFLEYVADVEMEEMCFGFGYASHRVGKNTHKLNDGLLGKPHIESSPTHTQGLDVAVTESTFGNTGSNQ